MQIYSNVYNCLQIEFRIAYLYYNERNGIVKNEQIFFRTSNNLPIIFHEMLCGVETGKNRCVIQKENF